MIKEFIVTHPFLTFVILYPCTVTLIVFWFFKLNADIEEKIDTALNKYGFPKKNEFDLYKINADMAEKLRKGRNRSRRSRIRF